ncbi:MAG TPA: outer membrane beta-barrel protein, partial [Chitinophagaceae bacterium]
KKNVDAKTNKIDSAIARVTKPKVESNESQKLEWGVSVSAGPSIIKDKFLLAGIGKKANLSAYSPGVYGGSGTPGAAFNTQLGNQSSFAFKAGVVIKRTISKRSSLSTGLTYAYLTDKIHIGFKQSNNSLLAGLMSISTYYGGTGQTTFIDRFHFIELPLLFNWRLTADPRHFLSLDAGISVSYLVSTNALVYDTTGFGIYYHKNDQFAKGNISLLTGLSYHMVKKGFEWNIGPQFSFQLNKIIKSDFDERKYFLYTGIEGTIFFGKKKNK